MTPRRRNGKVPSCEPCRKNKVRCDHKRPICSRCQQRSVSSQCFYHPAPLTRRKERLPAPVAAAIRARPFTPSTPSSPELLIADSDGRSPFRSQNTRPPQSGYLGPTSFVSTVPGEVELDPDLDNGDITTQSQILHPYWMQRICEVLSLLDELLAIEKLVREYYDETQAAAIAAPLILNTLTPIRRLSQEIAARRLDGGISVLAAKVIQNTSQAFTVPPKLGGSEFHTLFTGPNIRLEIIGLIYSIAGRASFFGLAFDKFPSLRSATPRIEFGQKMLEASDTALQVCKMLTPVNDLTVFLLYENFLLTTTVHGYSSSSAWSRLGELSTDIFLLGIHTDSGSKRPSDLPLFLVESRRRLFATAYQFDKSLATFLGRPPRLPWRYSDSKLPLDISDEALVDVKSSPETMQNTFDAGGWNTSGVYQRSSWIRLRFLISILREEIMELSHQTAGGEMVDKLTDISNRCHTAWNSVPAHLRYTPHFWDDSLPLGVSIVLIISYLAYQYNNFLVQRMLAQHDPSTNAALLDVSATILSTVLFLGSQRQHMSGIHRDFTWTILLYGFPTANELIKALQNHSRFNVPLPHELSRSKIIRDLSVFISHLESTLRPGDVNFGLLSRASRAFSEILDEILEPSTGNYEDGSIFGSGLGLEDVNFLDSMDFGVMFDQWLA